MSFLTHLECSECGRRHEADRVQTVCSACNSPLLARYDLGELQKRLGRETVGGRARGLWRWAELLPVREAGFIGSLGEGDSPLLPARRLGQAIGLPGLWIKDESGNPTGTFKARGMAVAVSRAKELGVGEFVTATAGNAGGALAAYAARAGRPSHIFMPKDSPPVNVVECRMAGADVRLVDGLISDAGRLAAAAASQHGWFDVSTFKEPYRVEGKKTMGLEVAEAFDWELPDVIVYPTGGGTGLVGMWKAFQELEALGWIGDRRPRMVSVQAEGCAPIVQAFQAGADHAEPWPNASTFASGLRVPKPFADRAVLRVLRESAGAAVAVSEDEIREAQRALATSEGVWAAPEGAAALAAARKLLAEGRLGTADRVILFNTGTGLKYVS